MNIKKLPKWVQEHIQNLQRQRDVAVRELNNYIDSQTPSPFYVDGLVCTGEESGPSLKRRYIEGNKMSVNHDGVSLSIHLRDGHIDLQWHSARSFTGDVAFIPSACQAARLVSKDNMS